MCSGVILQGFRTRAGGARIFHLWHVIIFSPHLAHTVHFSQFSSPNTEGGILIGYRKKIKLVYELIPDSFWGYRHSIRSLIDCCEISCNYAF